MTLALLAVSGAACIGGETPDTQRGNDSLEPAPVAQAQAALSPQFGEACIGADCAPEIPMTGRASAAFRELDIAMRQFMKWRCVGAGVLSVSLRGRRVYERGFGRMFGPAANGLPGCDNLGSSAALVAPDTPMPVGSVSKIVTAMIVRDLVKKRIADRGLATNPAYQDIGAIKLLDPNLELLPPHLLGVLTGQICGPVTVTDNENPGCTRTCGTSGADVRWANVTLGDLIAHTSGWNAGAPAWETTVIDNLAALRGYTTQLQWSAEHQDVRSRNPSFQTNLDNARASLTASGPPNQPVYFVNHYNVMDGEGPLDEWMGAFLTRCLHQNPQQKSDASPAGGANNYSNTNYSILGRVAAHLATSGRFAAQAGVPSEHTGSALDLFLAQNGIDEGTLTPEGIFRWQFAKGTPGYVNPTPTLRSWSNSASSYYWTKTDQKRPWCRWNGLTCDFTEWRTGSASARRPWDFTSGEVPFSQASNSLSSSQGELVVEAPVLLRLINEYAVGNDDILQGRNRTECGSKCNRAMLKAGGLDGVRAYAISLAGGSSSIIVPTPNYEGRLTEDGAKTSSTITEKAGVDAVVAVNQDSDGKTTGTAVYSDLDEFVRWGLSRVDWEQVERELDAEERHIVGIDMNSVGDTYYWYANDTRKVRTGTLQTHFGNDAAISTAAYELPSVRVGADIVAVAIAPNDRVYAWYDDGKVSAGSSFDLDNVNTPYSYSLPPGKNPEDLVGIAIASDSHVYSWYRDGTRAVGTSSDLDYYSTGTYTLPRGQSADDIVDMAIAHGSDNRVWTLYRDGSISAGWSAALDHYSYTQTAAVEMAMDEQGDTHLWYANGYHKEIDGTLADNWNTTTVLSSGEYTLAPGRSPSDIIGLDLLPLSGTAVAWYANLGGAEGTVAQIDQFPFTFQLPTGKTWAQLVGIAYASNGIVYSWYSDGTVAQGTYQDLDSIQVNTYTLPPGKTAQDIEGIAVASHGDNHVWVRYRDGSVSEGYSRDLDYYQLLTP